MRDEAIMRMWRTQHKVPAPLTEEETVRFWGAASEPYQARVNAVLQCGKTHGLRCLIETGTYRGDMIDATLQQFDRIVSIELDPTLYRAAADKYADLAHVEIVGGDSGTMLARILRTVSEPCLFWLDGHYVPYVAETARGDVDTPVMQELAHILKHKVRGHVILIDDARCFIGPNPVLSHYPTIQELRRFVAKRRPDLALEVRDDIIRIARRP